MIELHNGKKHIWIIQYFASHVEDSEVADDYIDVSEEFAFNEFKLYCITIALI